MATSTSKTVGLVLLIFLIALLALRMTPLFFAPFGMFSGLFHSIGISHWTDFDFFPYRVFHIFPRMILPLALFILWIFVIVWVYRDAEGRGMNGVLWALLVFIGHILALIIYLIVRTDHLTGVAEAETTQPCPSCEKPVAQNFVFCPHCGAKLHAVCPGCDKPVENTWLVCPHCGKKLGQTK